MPQRSRLLLFEFYGLLYINAALIVSLWADGDSRSLRFAFYLTAFIATLLHSRLSFFVLVATACWYEIPTLLLGYPNQFALEAAVVGFLGAAALRMHFVRQEHEFTTCYNELLAYPLFLPAVASISYGLASLPGMLAEISFLNGQPLDVAKTWTAALVGMFRWNPASPWHGLSLMHGYLLHLIFIVFTYRRRAYFRFTVSNITEALAWGSLPVSFYALLQYIYPKLRPRFHDLVVGTLQGSNSLSFYCGLVLLASLYLLAVENGKRKKLMGGLAAASAFLPFLIGRGRTAWLALTITGLWLLTLRLRGSYNVWRLSQPSLVRPLLFTLAGAALSAVGTALVWPWISGDLSQGLELYRSAWHEGRWFNLLIPLGREHDYQQAWALMQSMPWLGIGLGNYFVKSEGEYALHSMLLSLPVELGIFGQFTVLLTASLTAFALWRAYRQADQARAWICYSTLLLYVIATFPYDVYLNYRSLALTFACLLWAASGEIKPSLFSGASSRPLFTWLTLALAFGACGLGLFTAKAPATGYAFLKGYKPESIAHQEFGQFHWTSLAEAVTVEKDRCLVQWLRPLPLPEGSGLRLGHCPATSPPSKGWKLSQLLAWETNHLQHPRDLFLWDNQWAKVCLCAPTTQDQLFYWRSHLVRTYAFLSGPGQDERMLGIASGGRQSLPRQSFIEDLTKGRTSPCDYELFL